MDSLNLHRRRYRRSFNKIETILDFPNLIDIQKSSYENFLQSQATPEKRKPIGMEEVFRSVFPIKDFNETCSLEYVKYALGKPKYDVDECTQRGMTFAIPIKIVVQLVKWDKDPDTGVQSIRDVKEQEVYFGEIPLMTENGTFIINGTERVIVSQMHRSPGVFFDHDKGKTHTGKILFSARIIPYRGSWLDFEFDTKDIVYVRIDRRRKLPATILLKALGYTTDELLKHFYKTEQIFVEDGNKLSQKFDPQVLEEKHVTKDIRDPATGDVLLRKGKKFLRPAIKKLQNAKVKRIPVRTEDVVGCYAAEDITDMKTGEILVEYNEPITEEKFEEILARGINSFSILHLDDIMIGPSLQQTLLIDKVTTQEEAILEIYRRLRPGDPPNLDTAVVFFNNLFFNPDRYDLSKVGRLKLNYKLELDTTLDIQTLRREDILAVVQYLLQLRNGHGNIDDIDHLGNRRVRSVGELLENQYRIGMVRMEKAIRERLSLQEVDTLMPHDLINAKPVFAVVKEFFGSSQLSQFMDQTNPLSEITHKRRLSALGPGGLTRERAGFEVRDVHPTHYGRICPVETPEGPNIGLISSLSTFARINEYGFIETPYRVVKSAKVSKDTHYLSALEEETHKIAQANAPLDEQGRFTRDLVSARVGGEFTMVEPAEIEYMDVSPTQLVSVAASLIPFLEHDDANRALMGSNMQRQAVPLLRTEAPIVGTGMEEVVAKDSGVTVIAKRDGVVEGIDATRIVVRVTPPPKQKGDPGVDIYNLIKFVRSNQNTCIHQKPIVRVGDKVKLGEVLADGPATQMGELSLGRNVIVAYMPWGGYNFEDSILISERLVKKDCFTSIHIEEFEAIARDTKLGKEEITRDIPNVGEEALKDLDESGIVRIGAEVGPGDILIGKITPKGETQLSPEEKLLRAIFGEKAGDVRDTSFRVPPGVEGTVINARVFIRKGVEKDLRTKMIEDKEVARLTKDMEDEIKILRESAYEKVKNLLVGKKTSGVLNDRYKDKVLLQKNKLIGEEDLEAIPPNYWKDISIKDGEEVEKDIQTIMDNLEEQIDLIQFLFNEKINRLKKGDELPPGVIKMVKADIAIKRKLSVGDKMAGRHGNKGVLSRILPEEDMPYLEDGTPVDVVLNPLGVPSRMNVGQILEAHLGWASKGLGVVLGELQQKAYDLPNLRNSLIEAFGSNMKKWIDALSDKELVDLAKTSELGIFMASPVFDGANEGEIKDLMGMAQMPLNGQATLHDGRTGDRFDQQVTVGIMYLMKLHHLVDDKIHARSIGPYSLVTQQPLGGKAQFGGQRLGEMEVWALEAYGAAYSLQEFLTVKSDDVAGRTRTYEAIVKGENALEPGLPESFNVLVKELQALALDVEFLDVEEPK
jgi:DNA-directed RNA polymerase subunit beta